MNCEDLTLLGLIIILISLLFVLIGGKFRCENFTAPGLTLTQPPSWFPQNAAQGYNKKNSETQMYLDRYPFYDSDKRDYISYDDSNTLASVYRFWRM